jgi:hypothetical protein
VVEDQVIPPTHQFFQMPAQPEEPDVIVKEEAVKYKPLFKNGSSAIRVSDSQIGNIISDEVALKHK